MEFLLQSQWSKYSVPKFQNILKLFAGGKGFLGQELENYLFDIGHTVFI